MELRSILKTHISGVRKESQRNGELGFLATSPARTARKALVDSLFRYQNSTFSTAAGIAGPRNPLIVFVDTCLGIAKAVESMLAQAWIHVRSENPDRFLQPAGL